MKGKRISWNEAKIKAIESRIDELSSKKRLLPEDKERLERFKRLRDALRGPKEIKEKIKPEKEVKKTRKK